MKVVSFNVNSIRMRLHQLEAVIQTLTPDIIGLQETKVSDDQFPVAEVEALGYHVHYHGQKTHYGVALLSKFPIEETLRGLPGDDADDHARYIECVISHDSGPVRVASIYLPNGNPAPGPKYDYKLAWMRRLKRHAAELLGYEERLILAGDYNIIPRDSDVHDPAAWEGDALILPQSRAAFREILNLGFTDAFLQADGKGHQYTFWDYQRGAWQKDHGIRIDHLLLSPQAADALKGVEICKPVRGKEKASDHVPVVGTFGF